MIQLKRICISSTNKVKNKNTVKNLNGSYTFSITVIVFLEATFVEERNGCMRSLKSSLH